MDLVLSVVPPLLASSLLCFLGSPISRFYMGWDIFFHLWKALLEEGSEDFTSIAHRRGRKLDVKR
jgi:hypothetical protein